MSSKAQRIVLIGKEATPGDGTTVNKALRAQCSLKAVPDKIVPDEDIGSFAPSRHYIGSLKAEGDLKVDGYYEHLPYVVSMAMGAGAVVGSAPSVWTYTLPNATAPTFATYNIEYSDGNNHIVKCKDTFATEMEIKGEAGKSWMFTPKLTGGNTTFPAAVGASLTAPATVTPLLMAHTGIYFADLYANIGSGSATGVLISFTWKLESLLHPKLFAGALYPTSRGTDKWKVTLTIIVEIDNATIESEKDKLLTTGQTAIRIRELSSNAGGAGIHWSTNLDGMYMLKEVAELDDRDGNNTVKMTYMAEKDAVGGNVPSIVISNGLTAY